MITAYAVAAGLRRLPAVTGIDGAPVQIIRHRSVAAIVSRHGSPLTRSRGAVLAHAGVCEDLMTKADAVLPVRFGEAFDDESALRASLEDRHDRLVRGLEHVRGRVEVGVRVRWDEPGATSTTLPTGNGAGDGRAYLMKRVAEQRRRSVVERQAEAVAVRVHAALGDHAADSRLQLLPTDRLLMSAVYLVARDHVDRMEAQVRVVAQEHVDVDILCTGPWPPYSFADGEETHAR